MALFSVLVNAPTTQPTNVWYEWALRSTCANAHTRHIGSVFRFAYLARPPSRHHINPKKSPSAAVVITMGKKDKKEQAVAEAGAEATENADYETKTKFCSIIAKPLADEKLCKKVLKLCKKASKRKQIRRGVKEVVKALRKKQKGWVAQLFRLVLNNIRLTSWGMGRHAVC